MQMGIMVFKNIIFEGKRVKRGVIRPKNRFNYSTVINVRFHYRSS